VKHYNTSLVDLTKKSLGFQISSQNLAVATLAGGPFPVTRQTAAAAIGNDRYLV